jgi:hypothetical protein
MNLTSIGSAAIQHIIKSNIIYYDYLSFKKYKLKHFILKRNLFIKKFASKKTRQGKIARVE